MTEGMGSVSIQVALDSSQIGTQAQTICQSIGSAFNESMSDITSSMGKMSAMTIGSFSGLAGEIKKVSNFGKLTGKIGKSMGEFQKAGGGIKGLASAFKSLFEINPQGLLMIVIISAIATAAVLIIKNWGPIIGTFKNLLTSLIGAFNNVKNAIGSALNAIGGIFKQWGPLILTFIAPVIGIPLLIVQHWSSISKTLAAIWKGVRTAVMAIVIPFVAAIQLPFNKLKTGIFNIMNGIKAVFLAAWMIIKTVTLGPVLLLCDLITGNFKKLKSDIINIHNNLKNNFMLIWNAIKSVVTLIVRTFVSTIENVFKNGVLVLKSIGNGVKSFFAGLWNGIKNTAVSVWNSLLGFFSGLPGKFGSAASKIGNAVKNGFNEAISYIKHLPSEALNWGKDIINGIVKGIKSAVGGIKNAVSGVAANIRKFLHFSTPDEGPLVDYESWMPDMMNGLAKGIDSGKPAVIKALQGLTSGIATVMNPSLLLALASAGSPGERTITTNNTKAPVININGPVNLSDRGGREATLQQLQFLSAI